MTDPAAPAKWDPAHYLKYANLRVRPALDLLARIPLDEAAGIVDLGCGPGNVVPYLQARYANARIIGVDNSSEMLAAAESDHGDAALWVRADIARWSPDGPQDLIYSNAALQWLDRHEDLFPRLIEFLKPGGVLAVQMPNQFQEPSHVLMRQVAMEGPWAETLKPLLREAPLAEPGQYYDWLKPRCETVEIWETAYLQTMSGSDPVLDWLGSTALKSLREALHPDQRGPFREVLGAKLKAAYPPRADGVTLFPFKRLFIVAKRGV